MTRLEKLEIIGEMREAIGRSMRTGVSMPDNLAINVIAMALAVIADQLVDDETAVVVRIDPK